MINGFGNTRRKMEDTTIMIFPDTEWKFNKTDGYIEFCRFVINLLIDSAKNQEIKDCILKLYRTINKLQDQFVRFNGSSKEDFEDYVTKISNICEKDCFDIDVNIIKASGKTQCEEMLDKYSSRKNLYYFYYESEVEFEKELKDELIKQLCHIKMSKEHNFDGPSMFLTKMGYHEHIHDAINVLIPTLVYAFNCYSFRNENCIYDDIDYINNHIKLAISMIERIEFLK